MPVGATSLARELPIVLGGIGLFYSVIAFARYWSGPVSSQAEISLHPAALPKYALFSVLRLAIAYIFSFVFTLVYGYVAAYNRRGRALHDSAARHVAVHPCPQFPSRRDDLDGGSFSQQAVGRRAWIGPADFHRPGVEHDVQFLFVSEEYPHRNARSGAGVSFELVAAVLATRVAAGGDWANLEFDDVSGRRLVLFDGVRNVCFGQPRFSSARPGLLSSDRRQRGRHASDFLGFDDHDRCHHSHRSNSLAPGDRVGGEVQARTGRLSRDSSFADIDSAA